MASPRAIKKKRARRPSRAGIPYKKSEATREHLLATAVDLIARRGLAGASFTELAEAAGTSKGGIAYYFESKDELLASVLARCCEVMEARVRAAFLGGELAPLERVRRALAEMWRHRSAGVAEMRALTELHMFARQDPALRRSLGEALTRARRQMIDVGLTSLLTLGIRPRVDAELVPRLIIGMLDGLALQHEVDPLGEAQQTELLHAIELAIVGLFTTE
ncbi:MAG: TetR/AcrR family transcriptional regulator [Labilithrix sp.]|nr:TetR/AcrR family transcriptional regulator [Labilithrix sp.]MCW5816338.1 TetR/AcrR family transcriptional regulator [Labilithrix sp.]